MREASDVRTGAVDISENTCKPFTDRRNQLLTARREGSISLSHQEAQTTLRRDVLLLFFHCQTSDVPLHGWDDVPACVCE